MKSGRKSGYKHTKEQKQKIRIATKKAMQRPEVRENILNGLLRSRNGQPKKPINYCIDCGKKISPSARARCWDCHCIFCKGKNNNRYIDGRTALHGAIRNLHEYKEWRTEIFKKDNYTCQECSYKGQDIESHHKKEFHIIFTEFLKEYDQFSPIEDKETLARLAMKYKDFWNIDNGKTLCKDCHKLTRRNIKIL